MGMRGERRGVARGNGLAMGFEGVEELELEVGAELGVELELELDPDPPAGDPADVAEAGHKSFIKPVHNSSLHKSAHK